MIYIRYNNLKIILGAEEAKVGGNVGAMSSPYLFSTNLIDFCKRFNELTKDYLLGLPLTAKIYCDLSEKVYILQIKQPSIAMLIRFFFNTSKRRKIEIIKLYDLCLFFSVIYTVSIYKSVLIVFSIFRAMRRKVVSILLLSSSKLKVENFFKFQLVD